LDLLKYVFNVFNRYTEDKIRYLTSGYIGKLFILLIILPLSIVATGAFVFLGSLLWKSINGGDFANNIVVSIFKLVAMFVMCVLGIALVFSTGAGLLQYSVIAYKAGRGRGTVKEIIKTTKTKIDGDKETTIVTEESPKKTWTVFDYIFMAGCIVLFAIFVTLILSIFKYI